MSTESARCAEGTRSICQRTGLSAASEPSFAIQKDKAQSGRSGCHVEENLHQSRTSQVRFFLADATVVSLKCWLSYFFVPAFPGYLGKESVKWVCVCMLVPGMASDRKCFSFMETVPHLDGTFKGTVISIVKHLFLVFYTWCQWNFDAENRNDVWWTENRRTRRKLKTAATSSSTLAEASREAEVLGGAPGIAGTATTISMPCKCSVSLAALISHWCCMMLCRIWES